MALRKACLWLYTLTHNFSYRREESMEEKKFSPEQPDEVIELFDIVEPIVPDESPVQAEQEEAPAVDTDEKLTSSDEEVLILGAEDDSRQSEPIPTGTAEVTAVGEQPAGEQPVLLAAEEEILPEQGQSEGVGIVTDAVSAADAERAEAGEPSEKTGIEELEARIAALEEANRELAENVESLSQQLAQVGTMFLEDASVRLWMEEMVSRMLDARLPSSSDSDMAAEDESDLACRVEAIERRLKEDQAGSEQMAAAVAARVIRDEIAAMKAEAAGLSSR